MRVLVDMNLTPRWVSYLRAAGHPATHWSEVGSSTASDRQICTYARESRCIVLTNDLDFPQILAHTTGVGPSVIILRGEPLVPEVRGGALLAALEGCSAELERGAILSLDWSGRPRARLLPL